MVINFTIFQLLKQMILLFTHHFQIRALFLYG